MVKLCLLNFAFMVLLEAKSLFTSSAWEGVWGPRPSSFIFDSTCFRVDCMDTIWESDILELGVKLLTYIF